MKQLTKQFALSASALAAALLITACGGGATTDDTTAPTVAISAAVGAGGATTFTFVFSEDVGTSFVVEDVVVTGGGTVGAFAKVSATNYTLIVTPPSSAEGTLAVSVAASKFKDVALNDNTVAAQSSQAFDTSKLATFDETVALTFVGFDGAEATSIAAGPTGGTGNALKIIRTGGQVWAGAKLTGMTLGVTSTKNTFSARVHSPTAGIPFILKLEGNGDTGEITANETVAVGWQTLTWTVPSGKIGPVRDVVAFFPKLGTLGAGEIYYVDDVKLITGTTTVAPSAELVFSSKYGDRAAGSSTEWISAEGGFAGRYIQEDVGALSWWTGIAPNDDVPSFYFGYGVPSANKPWGFGAYVSAPSNGVAAVSSYTNVQISVWGNDQLINTRPNLTVLLQGAPVNGCTAKVKGNIAVVANGAQTYTLPLSGFSLEAACAYSSVSQVLAGGVAEVHLQVLGSNLQYTVAGDPGFYSNGLNVGPIKFK